MILDVSSDFFCFYTIICKVRQWTDFRIVNLAYHLYLNLPDFFLEFLLILLARCQRLGNAIE